MWSFSDHLEHTQIGLDDHKKAGYGDADMRENPLQQEFEKVKLANPGAQATKGPLDGQNGALI